MRPFRILLTASLILATLAAVASPAGAEIDPTNRTWWGVDSPATGTTTDAIDADVWAITQIDDVVYVGGKFTEIAHEQNRYPQAFLAAFDAATGVWIDTWTPILDGPVYALAPSPDGSRLFVGGEFETVDGSNVKGLVALDPETGFVDWGWRTRVSGGNPAVVRGLDVEGDDLYVTGAFDFLGVNGNRVAAQGAGRVSVASGTIDTTWTPTLAGGGGWDVAASKTNDDVYVVGSFSSVNGVSGTRHAVRLDDAGQVSGTWRYQLNHNYPEWAHAVETTPAGLVFIGGSQHILTAYREADMAVQWSHFTNPRGGDYQAIHYDAATGRVYASCHCFNQHWSRDDGQIQPFNSPVGTQSDIDWVIAYDGATGAKIDSFQPDFAGEAGPWALHTSPNGCLWVGGGITQAAGVRQHSLAKICDPALLDSQRPSTPTMLEASNPTASTVDLVWNGSTDNVAVTEYEVYDSDTDRVVATSTTPSVTVTGLAPVTYRFHVKARDADGNRSWRTNIVTVALTGDDTERPSVPRALNVTARDAATVSLTWLASSDNVGVVGYELIDPATGAVLDTVTTTSATIASDPGSQVAVRAFDAAGNRSWRSNTQDR